MYTLLYNKAKRTVEAMDFSRCIRAEKVEKNSNGRKDDDRRFLGVKRCDLSRLPLEERNSHGALIVE